MLKYVLFVNKLLDTFTGSVADPGCYCIPDTNFSIPNTGPKRLSDPDPHQRIYVF